MNLEPLEAKIDTRGALVEAFKLPNDGQVFYILAEAGETRGQHYHLERTEHFLVVSGSAVIQSKDRSTNNVMKVEVSGQKPMLVTIPPNNTHDITANDGGAVIMVWSNTQYDKDNPDTYQEEI